MAMHSKIYQTAKQNYKAGLWSKERLRSLVDVWKLSAAEYKEITGETYEPRDD